ncbi:PH domain-containing protein [Actinospongicola halichondriae]|uniref:PH domain-containing protein n=1 Tax=Actinospongicola halichondriae TaxID=3236844 RepID=UPI003D428134
MTEPSAIPTDGRVPLEHRVLVLWRVRIALVVAVVAVVWGVALALLLPALVALAALGAALGVVGGVSWWWTALVWRSWRFEIGTAALRLEHGVLIRRSSTIPYHRVQHIDLEAGPIERRMRLTTLILRTASASSDSTVPGIDAAEAEVVRTRILSLVGTGDAT